MYFIALKGESWISEYASSPMLMHTILGGWDRGSGSGANVASKMCAEVAELELAQSVSTFNICYKDTGLFRVFAVANDNKLNDLMLHITSNLVKLVHKMTDEKFERAKVKFKATMHMRLDGNSQVTKDIGQQLCTYGRCMIPVEIFARIIAISTDDIKGTIRKMINDEDHVLVAVGGIHELPDIVIPISPATRTDNNIRR